MRVLGPDCVDELIRSSVTAISEHLTANRLYQVGASQLMAIIEGHAEKGSLELVIGQLERLLRSGAEDGRAFMSGITIGIVRFKLGAAHPADLLRWTLSAAQDARQSDNPVGLYCATSDAAHRRRYDLIAGLRDAVKDSGQFRLEYQPTVSLASGLCDGVEALLRWDHPTLGPIPPAEFIPIAEQTAMAKPLTAWVIDAALAQSAAWRRDWHRAACFGQRFGSQPGRRDVCQHDIDGAEPSRHSAKRA
jgi:predicted signal transduction protein with EAL and GGDEF domain